MIKKYPINDDSFLFSSELVNTMKLGIHILDHYHQIGESLGAMIHKVRPVFDRKV